jgi:RimJ/RimL family protein N-acetyltransferase
VDYPLQTERLRIEPLAREDLLAFVAYRRETTVARYQSWETTFSDADGRALIEDQPQTQLPGPGEWLQLAIRSKPRLPKREAGDGRPQSTDGDGALPAGVVLLGDLAIHRVSDQPDTFELGVTLAPAFQGHGIAREAFARIVDFLFEEAHAHRIFAVCDSRNLPVARLLHAVGMRKEAHQPEADFLKGEWTTIDTYALLATERAGGSRPAG